MNLEAVTVCVDYSDFLAETIPFNLQHFDKWVIVTTPADGKTRELCRKWGLHAILTDEVYRDGDEFNKGRAIIRGVDHLTSSGWVLHIDADVALPMTTRHMLESAHLDPNGIYGVDRFMVRNWDQWQAFKRSGFLNHDYHMRVNSPKGFDIGTRWASSSYGYCPIGFFQLWHAECDLYKGVHTRPYPHRHGDAARGDVQHALQWDRRDRHLIPELLVAHLESEPAKLGANWKGRTTKRFGP